MFMSDDYMIVIGYRLGGQGLIPSRGKRFFSASQCADWLWAPPSFLSSGYRERFAHGCLSVKPTAHLHLVPRSRMAELSLHSPIHIHGMMLN
jgi:hypothetical protein